MNTFKQVIKEKQNNQALFDELTDYISSYEELKKKRGLYNMKLMVESQNEKLKKENKKLRNIIHTILQTMKEFFRNLQKLATEKDKDNVVNEITGYYDDDLYSSKDLHDIADNIQKEEEITDYLYNQSYDYYDRGIDI